MVDFRKKNDSYVVEPRGIFDKGGYYITEIASMRI
jgi:hypothetical protein